MNVLRRAPFVVLGVIYTCVLAAGLLTPASYEFQDRDHPNEPPGQVHPLGTDELGRDRFSRLLYGSRTSLLLAPAAAALSTALATLLGIAAGQLGGVTDRLLLWLADLFTCTPWLFLLLTIRALLPLNVPASTSVCITFFLLATVGWAAAMRVVRAAARGIAGREFMVQARATGLRPVRLLFRHSLPNLKPVIIGQFWTSIPVFVLAEANLSMLGLGVTEPLPSWGNLLSELRSYGVLAETPWLLAPALLMLTVMGCLYLALPKEN